MQPDVKIVGFKPKLKLFHVLETNCMALVKMTRCYVLMYLICFIFLVWCINFNKSWNQIHLLWVLGFYMSPWSWLKKVRSHQGVIWI